MPPKQKYSREDILQAAFQLVREHGIENLNVRSVAKMLQASTQPVFSYYENMADLKTDLFAMVSQYHGRYFDRVETGETLLSSIGMTYIDFAIEEPNLFRMMFMAQGFSGTKLGNFFESFSDDCNERLTKAISASFDLEEPETMGMFVDMWLYAHGIASMLVMNQLPTPRSEIETMVQKMAMRRTR